MLKCNVIDLGMIDYQEFLALQESLWQLRSNNAIDDTLLLLEHPPVLTLGRQGNPEHILISWNELAKMGVKIYEVNRGGDITYHGPGQIVGYPIMDLNGHGRDIKAFIRKLEDCCILLLEREYAISARSDENSYTGVWVGDQNIAAIGIAIKHWITMHGFAFNVNTRLEHYRWIVPCGIADKGVTSLERLTGKTQNITTLKRQLTDCFAAVFGAEMTKMTRTELESCMKGSFFSWRSRTKNSPLSILTKHSNRFNMSRPLA
jgi:lipoyl(octanoyl) transferase